VVHGQWQLHDGDLGGGNHGGRQRAPGKGQTGNLY
jgi:hypothetical protein